MPVTARLSKAFYDQFGEQVTNELVEWFNQVDLTYRTDLRTLNDTNFARFEALLESRFARADVQLERQLNERFAEFERRLEKRFLDFESRLETRLEVLEQQLGALEERYDRRFVSLEQEIAGIRRGQSQQLRWMVGLWATSMIGLFAIFATLINRA